MPFKISQGDIITVHCPKISSFLSELTSRKKATIVWFFLCLFLHKHDLNNSSDLFYVELLLSYYLLNFWVSIQRKLIWCSSLISLISFGTKCSRRPAGQTWASCPQFCLCHVTWFLGVGSYICFPLVAATMQRSQGKRVKKRSDSVTCC